MSDQRRLQDKLQKFAAPGKFVSGGRALEDGAGGGYLGSILQEIDETILARLLIFETDHGMVVKLDVANRRLLRLNHLSAQEKLAAHTGLIDQIFSDTDAGRAKALAAVFRDFLAGAKTVHVSAEKLGRIPEATEIGYSAQYLADACGIGLYGADPVRSPDVSAPFIGYCQDIALAWIRIDAGGKTEQSGPPDDLAPLRALSDDDSSKRTRALNGLGAAADAGRCIILGHDTDEKAIIYLEAGPEQLFCLIAGGQLAAVISGWHSID